MKSASNILLTGVTGLLGRYLLRDLLLAGHRVAVLVRDSPHASAHERVAELLDFWAEVLQQKLSTPVVLSGELTLPGLGLGVAERCWLARHCGSVLHSAANVAYQPTERGEPWETNVHGTCRLLELCQRLGIPAVHHLSTAFLCGDRRGLVLEDELDCGTGPNNAYEQSKFAAEQLLGQTRGVQVTVYRPSVIVGDSHTGYTSTYHHFYRFLELAIRLSKPTTTTGTLRRRLPIRLPLSGEETQDLVPVDWVAQAIVRLLGRPQWHGRTFHLVARQPLPLREIKAIIEQLLHLEGIQWVGSEGLSEPTSLEQLVLEQFRDYWTYLRGSLVFDCRNTRLALPDLPPPVLDHHLTARLLEFALADHWGRGPTRVRMVSTPSPSDCRHYLEEVLPKQVRQFAPAKAVGLDLTFAFDIRGPEGGEWSYCWQRGELVEVRRGLAADAAVIFHTDAATFTNLVRGRQSPQEAFFEGRIDIDGDTEKGLQLAALFEQFLAEMAGAKTQHMEVRHATPAV